MTDAVWVFPDASLKVNSVFEDPATPAAWATLAARKAEATTKPSVWGPFRPIKSASYRADRLPAQAVFRKKMRNLSGLRNCAVARDEAVISVEAPGRLEVLGNHTDYNEGVVLGAAIDRAVRIRGGPRPAGRITMRSRSYPPVEITLAELRPQQGSASWANYSLGVANELIVAGAPIGGFLAEIESDLPGAAGLGSSAAVAIAMVFFLLKLTQRELPPMQIAKLCQRAENRFAGVRSGLLDQVMSIFGRANHLVFFDCRSEELRTISFPKELLFIVADSGVKRELATAKYNERRAETHAAAAALGLRTLRDVSSVAALSERRTYTAENLRRSETEATAGLSPVLRCRATHVVGRSEERRVGKE